MAKSYVLKLTSAVAIDGQICRKDSLVEVSEAEAKNLLARGKAEVATADELLETETDEAEATAEKPAAKRAKKGDE